MRLGGLTTSQWKSGWRCLLQNRSETRGSGHRPQSLPACWCLDTGGHGDGQLPCPKSAQSCFITSLDSTPAEKRA